MIEINKSQFEKICRYLVDDFYSDDVMEKLADKPFVLSDNDIKMACTMISKIIHKEAQTIKFIQRSAPTVSINGMKAKMDILNYFKHHPEGVTSQDLANRFCFSSRTGSRCLKEWSEQNPENVSISGKKQKIYRFSNVDEMIKKITE